MIKKSTTPDVKQDDSEEVEVVKKKKSTNKKDKIVIKKKKQQKHELCDFELKGHTDTITAVGFKGEFLMSASKDGTVRLWPVESFNEKLHYRINMEYDYPSAAVWSSNGKALIISLEDKKSIEIYKITQRKEDGSFYKLLKEIPKAHIKSINTLSTHKNVLVSCSNDTVVKVWEMGSGNMLDEIDTKQLKNYTADLSPNMDYISISSSMGVRVWKLVSNNPENENSTKYEVVKPHVTSLSGHNKEVNGISFFKDGEGVITTSNDGTWMRWKLRDKRKKQFDCTLEKTVANPLGEHPLKKVQLSPDNRKIAVTSGNALLVFSVDGDVLCVIENAHIGNITSISWAEDSISLATGDEGGVVRIFKV